MVYAVVAQVGLYSASVGCLAWAAATVGARRKKKDQPGRWISDFFELPKSSPLDIQRISPPAGRAERALAALPPAIATSASEVPPQRIVMRKNVRPVLAALLEFTEPPVLSLAECQLLEETLGDSGQKFPN